MPAPLLLSLCVVNNRRGGVVYGLLLVVLTCAMHHWRCITASPVMHRLVEAVMSRTDGIITKTHLTLIDNSTNEIVDWVAVPRRRGYHPYGRRWIMLNQSEHTLAALREGKLTTADMAVLHALFVRLDFENIIALPQREITEMTGLSRACVQRSFGRLEAIGAIRRGAKNGNTQGWKFNPNLGWKGKTGNLRTAQRHLEVVATASSPDEAKERWDEINPDNNSS